MAISPPDILRLDLIESVIKRIDSNIINTAQHFGTQDFYEVVVPDNLSRGERAQIQQEYLECGWKSVTSKTSAENGERPGLLLFTLTP